MSDFAAILAAVQDDQRYQANLDWGQPRRGHAEGTVRKHIEELERNLHRLRHQLSVTDQQRLRIIIHTHDTFKADAKQGVAIRDPRSHASLARQFLAEFCDDHDVLGTVQWHDEPYGLWRKWQQKQILDADRFAQLIATINDWNLFLAFQIIDGCTSSKDRAPLLWFFDAIQNRVESRFDTGDLL